ncbi:hypothetical protein HYD70_03210 [Mycoplasmopsis bovis]|nr:hypothetical protein HYD70_03210 [Mycoplasmopsis bovis]
MNYMQRLCVGLVYYQAIKTINIKNKTKANYEDLKKAMPVDHKAKNKN